MLLLLPTIIRRPPFPKEHAVTFSNPKYSLDKNAAASPKPTGKIDFHTNFSKYSFQQYFTSTQLPQPIPISANIINSMLYFYPN